MDNMAAVKLIESSKDIYHKAVALFDIMFDIVDQVCVNVNSATE